MSTRKNYQALSVELDKIIDWFESGKVNLDEAVAKYEQANKLVAEMEAYLKTVENKIKKINTNFNKGK